MVRSGVGGRKGLWLGRGGGGRKGLWLGLGGGGGRRGLCLGEG